MKLLAISDAAREAGLTSGTLRRYERLGLLVPARDSGGRRLYTKADVFRAIEIKAERATHQGSGIQK